MSEAAAPVLLMLGTDKKRVQWLNHHVTSHWPGARVLTASSPQSSKIKELLETGPPDAVLLQIDFGREGPACRGISELLHLRKLRPDLHCIVLAANGSEMTAVKALKSGAGDYLPVAQLTRESLLASIEEALARRARAERAPTSLDASGMDAASIEVPGYTIVEEISTSNFSSVYLARSARLRRNVVLKVMRRGDSPRELEDAERFQREYEIISSITHRSIAEIYDHGKLPNHLYLAMEYFPCGDLRERLTNPVRVTEALYYLRAIAEALRVIHVFGVLHRDLKPANVMLREDNSPVLIDFGLARRAIDRGGVTGIGQVLGSPYYISPEQAQGLSVDVRTDLYSLGVMFYEMLTGQKPYLGGNAVEVMTQHTGAPVPRLPPELAAHQPMLDRLMAKETRARYASTDALLADLDPAAAVA